MPEAITVKPTKTEGTWYRWATAEELRAYDEARLNAQRVKLALLQRCRLRAARAAREASKKADQKAV
jgi:hypothetical protein